MNITIPLYFLTLNNKFLWIISGINDKYQIKYCAVITLLKCTKIIVNTIKHKLISLYKNIVTNKIRIIWGRNVTKDKYFEKLISYVK